MKEHIIHTSEIEWQDKVLPAVSPDRRGQFKLLSALHGLSQFEVRFTLIPPGEASTWYHRHSHIEEWFFVLRGECDVCIEGNWHRIRAMDSIATSPEDWHIFRNNGTADCELIMIGIEHPDDKAERIAEPPKSAE